MLETRRKDICNNSLNSFSSLWSFAYGDLQMWFYYWGIIIIVVISLLDVSCKTEYWPEQ